jgi:2,4-dichlorophenol 6-monooxygenase
MITWFHNPGREGMWSSGAMVPLGPTWGPHSEEYYILFAVDPDDPARREDEACRDHVAKLLNVPSLDIEVLKVSRWVLDGIVAGRYREGRVFLAGDGAHRHPRQPG